MYSTIETNSTYTKKNNKSIVYKLLHFLLAVLYPPMEVHSQVQVLHFMEAINEVKVDHMSKVSQSLSLKVLKSKTFEKRKA